MGLDGLLRRSVRTLKQPGYPPPVRGVLRMDANTNLAGVNPALARVARRIGGLDINQYPSCFSDDLRAALARRHGLSMNEVMVGDGSDEILDVICRTFVNPGDVVACPSPSFVMYAFFGQVHQARVVEVPLLRPEWSLDVEGLLRARAKVTFIASPNNPTGNAFSPSDLARLLRESKGIVVIDEAYADFCAQDYASRVRSHERLVVTRTFSKSYGLAGLRVGYGTASRPVMDRMFRAKTPLTLSSFSEAAAVEALGQRKFHRDGISLIRKGRERLSRDLAALGFVPQPSDANFLLVDLGRPSAPAREFLRRRGILTREMGDFHGLGDFIRVTVGRPEHHRRLIAALRAWRAS